MLRTEILESKHKSDSKPLRHIVSTGSLVALEDYFGIKSGYEALDTPVAHWLAFLAWHCRTNDGISLPPFEKWMHGVETVGWVSEEEEDDDLPPTEAAPDTAAQD